MAPSELLSQIHNRVAFHQNESATLEQLPTLLAELRAFAEKGELPEGYDPTTFVDMRAHPLMRLLVGAPFGEPIATMPPRWATGKMLGIPEEREFARLFRMACARERIYNGALVPRAWLASLAGISKEAVAQSVHRGLLMTVKSRRGRPVGTWHGDEVLASSAIGWLADRGITVTVGGVKA